MSVHHPVEKAEVQDEFGVRVFAGLACAVSMALVAASVLYLTWFVALGRPTVFDPQAAEAAFKLANAAATPEQVEKAVHDADTAGASLRTALVPVEMVVASLPFAVGAFFSALFLAYYRKGAGLSHPPLWTLTGLGTAASIALFWLLVLLLDPTAHLAHGVTVGTTGLQTLVLKATAAIYEPIANMSMVQLVAFLLPAALAGVLPCVAPLGNRPAEAAPPEAAPAPAH